MDNSRPAAGTAPAERIVLPLLAAAAGLIAPIFMLQTLFSVIEVLELCFTVFLAALLLIRTVPHPWSLWNTAAALHLGPTICGTYIFFVYRPALENDFLILEWVVWVAVFVWVYLRNSVIAAVLICGLHAFELVRLLAGLAAVVFWSSDAHLIPPATALAVIVPPAVMIYFTVRAYMQVRAALQPKLAEVF
jgi:hypothetical protein